MNLDKTNMELYDLTQVGNESQNMAQSRPELVKKFSEILFNWWSSLPQLENQDTEK